MRHCLIILAWAFALHTANAEETTLSKACIFEAAAHLPAVPGLTITTSSTSPSSAIPVRNSDPTVRNFTVVLTVQAAAQSATYEGTCLVGSKTPAGIENLHIRDTPAGLPAEQPKKQ